MVVGRIGWQCRIGSHFQASTWADCEPAVTAALELQWASGEEQEFRITEWPNYTFAFANREGRRTMTQKNEATGTERQLRRIIVVQE